MPKSTIDIIKKQCKIYINYIDDTGGTNELHGRLTSDEERWKIYEN